MEGRTLHSVGRGLAKRRASAGRPDTPRERASVQSSRPSSVVPTQGPGLTPVVPDRTAGPGRPRPVVSVVAPAGRQEDAAVAVGRANGQAFAGASVDEGDNDPKVLLSYVAEALDAVQPVDGRVFDALPPRRVRCPARLSPG